MLDQELAALVLGEAFFQAHFAGFDLVEDLLELGEGFLEVLRRCLCFLGHG